MINLYFYFLCSSRMKMWASLIPDSLYRPQWTVQTIPHSVTVQNSPLRWDLPPYWSFVPFALWNDAPPTLFTTKISLIFCISLMVPFESEGLIFGLSRQGFTYVAPSVLESLKEGFSFEPRTRPVRRHNSSPRTPIRWSLSISFDLWTVLSIHNCTQTDVGPMWTTGPISKTNVCVCFSVGTLSENLQNKLANMQRRSGCVWHRFGVKWSGLGLQICLHLDAWLIWLPSGLIRQL